MSKWKTYESHKIVQAALIEQIWQELDTGLVVSAKVAGRNDWAPTVLTMLENADIGDYAILYPDGYKSVCPKAQFEAGYTEVQS